MIDAQEGVPTKRKLVEDGVDLVYGGPPCQGFSQIGPRDLSDPRNLLYREFARVLKALKPKAFLMENVPNMVAMKNGHYRDLILGALRAAGYKNTALVHLTASEFGVPQHRKRVFFVGLRDDLDVSDDVPKLTAARRPPITPPTPAAEAAWAGAASAARRWKRIR